MPSLITQLLKKQRRRFGTPPLFIIEQAILLLFPTGFKAYGLT